MKQTLSKFKIGDLATQSKERWVKLSNKEKQRFIIIGCGVVFTIVVAALIFSFASGGYAVLYPGIDEKEAVQVLATLKESGVDAKVNANGEVTVPSKEKDAVLLKLAGSFPTSVPNYGIYSTNSGFTATESDRKFYLNAQLQNRIQETLTHIDGVKTAIVNLNIAETGNYVWENNKAKSSASVTVTMKNGAKLSPNHAATIKQLIAGSVPTMSAESVVVIDASTMLEVKEPKTNQGETLFDLQRLDYEAEYEQRLVNKIEGLLSSVYGVDGVRAIATVVLDYDKMLTEQMQYVPEDNGSGVKNHIDESYKVGGNAVSGGVVGEENNTDIPTYENAGGTGDGEYTNIERSIDYSISYVKQQIEKGEALLKKASISVIVKDADFTAEKQDQLVNLISKGANIEPSNISVTNLTYNDPGTIPAAGGSIASFIEQYKIPILATAGIIVLMIILLMLLSKRGKKSKEKRARELPDKKLDEAYERERQEIEDSKRRMKKAAEHASSQETQVTKEIREFAQENPEITASLIRAWLREDE